MKPPALVSERGRAFSLKRGGYGCGWVAVLGAVAGAGAGAVMVGGLTGWAVVGAGTICGAGRVLGAGAGLIAWGAASGTGAGVATVAFTSVPESLAAWAARW